MALCPFATHKLIAPGSSDPRITARAAILHVDAGNAESLFSYFNGPSGGVESHFFIKKTGEIEQYRDTAFQADANLDANDFAISIETQGFGEGEWTKQQIASIKRLLLWLHETHDIPLRKIQVWNGAGVGYHTQFGAPSHWTPVAKSCPGPDRIKQFNTTLVRWFKSNPAQPAPKPPVLNTLTAIEWNCYTANSDADVLDTLRAWVEKYHPHVFALSEAATHADVLPKLKGYTLFQRTPPRDRTTGNTVDDTGDVALLVRDDIKVRFSWVEKMKRAWTVLRYNRKHTPHEYEVSNLKVGRQVWRVRASHWPTHGLKGPNSKAVVESARSSRRWLRRSLSPAVDLGDLNETRDTLAVWYGPKYRVYGKGIDVAVTSRVDACEWHELGKGGGDHHGRFYKFTKESR